MWGEVNGWGEGRKLRELARCDFIVSVTSPDLLSTKPTAGKRSLFRWGILYSFFKFQFDNEE